VDQDTLVIPNKARDLGSCPQYQYHRHGQTPRSPRFARDDSAEWDTVAVKLALNLQAAPSRQCRRPVPNRGGEVTSSESESLLDASGDRQFGSASRNAVVLAKYPHGSGAVVELEDSGSRRSEGIGNLSRNGDLLAGEPAWILVNLGDALPGMASR
jgi:hypothetical protein